jgi:hypothetical protein
VLRRFSVVDKTLLTPSRFLLVRRKQVAVSMWPRDRLYSISLIYEVGAATGDLRRFVGLVIVR